jgi:hypothetical protein
VSVDPQAESAEQPAAGERRALMSRRGATLTAVLVVLALILGLLLAPGGPGGFTVIHYTDSDLSLLVPAGWQDENLASPFGTAISGWRDAGGRHESEVVEATRPAGLSPQARVQQLERRLQLPAKSFYLGTVAFPGRAPAWALLYSQFGHAYAVFEFDACPVATAVTVTLTARGTSVPGDLQQTLAPAAEPVCDSSAFTSPDRADLAIPLRLPSSS